ncbi:MAG: biopolymer transporter ExbD [Proteobacteria bacterium]|nr:biopolymer transporter ExbD [Pseudomonadota bacterium]MDA1302325.1 biopolymer transporter ExbD [Pseudomonadota bacterium]
MKFARRARGDVEVNLTPLIDVVFLLLIFFMVSTTFTRETHLSIDLPEADGDPATVAETRIEVSISQQGDFAVNGTALVNSSVETLKRALEKVGQGDTTMPLMITADAATPHQAVVTAMDAAGQLGFAALSITTKNVSRKE